MRLAAILLLALAASPALAQRAPDPSRCELRGGEFADCKAAAQLAVLSRVPVVLEDGCASGCTMQLLSRRVCVRPGARVGFHAAAFRGSDVPLLIFNDALNGFYHRFPALQRALKRDGALLSTRLRWYSAEDLARYGVPLCQ